MSTECAGCARLEKELEAAKRDVAELTLQIKSPGGSFCAYCRKHFERHDTEDARLQILEHITNCDKHPLSLMLTKWQESESQLEQARQQNEAMREALKFYVECGEVWHQWRHDEDGDPDGAVVRFSEEASISLKEAATEALRLPPLPASRLRNPEDFPSFLRVKADWSNTTFGPGMRTERVCRHIEKELSEIRQKPGDLLEWVDVVLLGLDGAMRAGFSPDEIWAGMKKKQEINMARTWPSPKGDNEPIEHVRSALDAQEES